MIRTNQTHSRLHIRLAPYYLAYTLADALIALWRWVLQYIIAMHS